MANWKQYFIISGCTRFVLPGIGEINAENENISLEKLKKAYYKKCPYVSLTEEGIMKYDPDKKPIIIKKIEISEKQPEKKPEKGKTKKSKKPY